MKSKGLHVGFVAPHLLALMTPATRAKLGKAGMTSADGAEKWAAGEERKMHDLFARDMERRGVKMITSIFGRKGTIRKGWPDFTLLKDGRGCCVEFKAPGGKLSNDQEICIAELRASGVPVLVAYGVAEAIAFVRTHLENAEAQRLGEEKAEEDGAARVEVEAEGNGREKAQETQEETTL